MWLWPVWKFWIFTPWGWLAAVAWNIFEVFHITAFPSLSPRWFGLIVGCNGKPLDSNDDRPVPGGEQ